MYSKTIPFCECATRYFASISIGYSDSPSLAVGVGGFRTTPWCVGYGLRVEGFLAVARPPFSTAGFADFRPFTLRAAWPAAGGKISIDHARRESMRRLTRVALAEI